MGYERIILEFDNNVATIRLNHPEVLNAMGSQMVEEFSLALLEVGDPANGARCLLLMGEGRAFCSGANLTDEGRAGRTGGARTTLRRNYHPLLCGLRDLEMPMVTAVHGPAAGVGMSFALMADIVCASKEGYFLQAFARIGLVPDGGATFLLPRLIGWGRAVELSMLAEKLPAERAHEWGLVNRLYEDREALMEGASEMAQRLARGPRSLALIRRAYWATWQNSYEQQLDLEARSQGEASSTEDAKEGRDSFLEKREARFQGR